MQLIASIGQAHCTLSPRRSRCLTPRPILERLHHRLEAVGDRDEYESSADGVEHYLAERIDARVAYEVSTVSVPVVGDDGVVQMAINLFGFDGAVSGREIARLGRVTRAAADRLAERLRPASGAGVE